jgi:L-histidine N-alpha-methyltransferase
LSRYDYVDHLPVDFTSATLRSDVLNGLMSERKWLPPKWFYDKTGSALFEEITRLPEYYPTRAEREILERSAGEVVRQAGCRVLVELGSGSSEKTRLLLAALPAQGSAYIALDVSETALREAGASVAADFPELAVTAVRADFENQLPTVLGPDPVAPEGISSKDLTSAAGGPRAGRMVAFLGGTIGNLAPEQRRAFLAAVRAGLSEGDSFLLGADLVKSPQILVPAYSDAAGVTAAFNLNVLEVLNRRLAADFDRRDFEHRAVWDAGNAWIEMRLRALRAVRVRIGGLGVELELAAGEEIRTEISAKFTRERLETEFAAAGFAPAGWWTDVEGLFSLSLWRPA